MEELRGTGVALITPFTEHSAVDVAALEKIVAHCITGGVDYLVALGTTAESITLSKEEKQLVVNTIVAANNEQLPLVLGIGGNNTRAVVEEIKETNTASFCAILSVSPYYNRPSQEGIYQHFKAIAEVSPKPILLYNVPGRTGSNMLPATTLRLARDFDNIIGIKEASGNLVQAMEIIKRKPDDFLMISGDDITSLSTVLAGGDGVISVLAQGLPQEYAQMIRLGLDGDAKKAFQLHYLLQDGMSLIFEEGNPAGIKAIFELLGFCTAAVRLPLVSATKALKQKLGLFMYAVSKVPV